MPRVPSLLPKVPAAAVPLALLALLIAVNGLSVAGIVAVQRAARTAALKDLELQTQVHARALEAALAALRVELVQLTRAEPLRGLIAEGRGTVPLAPAEDALLLFHQRHPEVRALALRDRQGAPLLLTARQPGEEALLLPAANDPPAPIADRTLFVAQLPVAAAGERGLLEVWVALQPLLAAVAPNLGGRLELRPAGDLAPAAGSTGTVRATVRDALWSPPLNGVLVRDERESRVLAPVAELAASFRRTVLLNVGIILLSLLLGLLALRQARQSAALAAENRQQARLRELERQVLHAERLASVGRLAAGVAHEVNNPLEGMSNYLTMLEEDLAAGEAERARALVPRVREGLTRIAGVTRQVLAFSDPGRSSKVELDLRRPVSEAVEFVRRHPAFRAVDLRLAQPDEPLPIEGNPTTLGQLFLNLLLNAAQCQNESGVVEVTATGAGGEGRVTVADRGPGLSVEAERHLFEPFYSTRGSTGLGLAACHGIAADHGGTLEGRNRPGGGAEFVLALPLLAAARGARDVPAVVPAPADPVKAAPIATPAGGSR
jgi:signal transduction histidine kinase